MKSVLKKIIPLATVVFAIGFAGNASAIPIELSFSGNVFDAISGTTAYTPPTLSGSFTYEASSVTSEIDSLLAVDLTINGKVWTLPEITFVNDAFGTPGFSQIGGANLGPSSMQGGTEDFIFSFYYDGRSFADQTPGLGLGFVDGSLVRGESWRISSSLQNFTSFDISVAQVVSTPPSLALLGLGLVGLGFYRRKNALLVFSDSSNKKPR